MNNEYNDYLVNLDEFTNDTIELEPLTEKTIYNIYNNNVKFPSHNFWFILDHVKFINITDNKNNKKSIKISFNDKFKDNKKTVDCIYAICKHVENEYKKTNNKLLIEYPWNVKPILFNLYLSESPILTNYKNELITVDYLETTKKTKNTFKILFELIYYRIVDNVIKFSFNLIKLQEHENINIRMQSLFINEHKHESEHRYNSKSIITPHDLINKELKKTSEIKAEIKTDIKQIVPVLNLNDIVNGKDRLKKTPKKEIEPIHNPGDDYLKQKELLKSVQIIEEPTTNEKKPKKNKKNKDKEKTKKTKKKIEE
jgi:hypothetical protein